MQSMFSQKQNSALEINMCTPKSLDSVKEKLSDSSKVWLDSLGYKAAPDTMALVPDESGRLSYVLWGATDSFWQMANLASKLPEGDYYVSDWGTIKPELGCLAWALTGYSFDRYKKKTDRGYPRLVIPDGVDFAWVEAAYDSIKRIRDLINTPAEDMKPADLAAEAQQLAEQYGARLSVISGVELERDYLSIHAVGRAASAEPLLIDFRWQHSEPRKKIVLVGKGVCFDSGGLDIKPSSGMLIMKKDMGGAAHVLGLASMIMAMNLAVDLRVLIPAVENAIAGNAMRPGDVIKTRKGITVEIGNTDAEGRLILADALHEACQSRPDLIIDFATLTGAARVALGTELPALFSNSDDVAVGILGQDYASEDPLWRMPLHGAYKKHLKSSVADLNNVGKSSYGGAITAALFLEEFIEPNCPWAHIDLMAWNLNSTPGRPEGGEAMGLLSVFNYLCAVTN